MSNQYEFSSTQNAAFSSLAGAMKFVGIVMMVLGGLMVASVLVGNIAGAIQGVIQILVGLWTKSAANSIEGIVNTEGNDIDHLMSAVGDLDRLYTLQKWCFIVAFILIALAIGIGVMAAGSV